MMEEPVDGMSVPEHIYVAGIPSKTNMRRNRSQEPSRRSMIEGEGRLMEVPEKILVGGGGALIAGQAGLRTREWPLLSKEQKGVRLDEVPTVLTANDLRTDMVDRDSPVARNPERMWSQESSIAVEENPLRELKIMRRAIGRTNTRLLELEDQNRRRDRREVWLWLGFLSMLVFEAWRAIGRAK